MVDSVGIDRDRTGLINSEILIREVGGQNTYVRILARECEVALLEGNKGFNFILPLDSHIVYSTYHGDIVSLLITEHLNLNSHDEFYVFNVFGKPVKLKLKEIKTQTIGWPDRSINFLEGNLIIRS